MEEALYGEGGYYARRELRIGEQGDFVTGSSLSPLFGRSTARLLEGLDRALGRPADLLEAGYGTGAHLRAVVDSLSVEGRRLAGWDRVARELPAGARGFESLDEAPPVTGVVFSYELFDALPIHRLIGRAGELREVWVDLTGDGDFRWREGELSDPALASLVGHPLVEGQIADLAPGWRPLYRQLAQKLESGLLITCDYGFEVERLLDPRIRMHGTLACYKEQRVHRDPFVAPGEQDITAHVDFTALREEGESAGLETFAFTRQAPWLAATGLLEGLESAPERERLAAIQLMQLDGMGEEIRVLVQGRGVDWGAVVEAISGLAHL
jgi:SAM-dependent MidA family methyltransferase